MQTRQWVVAIATAVGICGGAAAQVSSIESPTTATRAEVLQWVTGADPRMVAWGAHFAAENGEQDAVPWLVRLAEEWQTLPPQEASDGSWRGRIDGEASRYREMQAVLDALIQMRAPVSRAAIDAVHEDFGAQALTLFARMPEPERRSWAAEIYAARRPGADYGTWKRTVDGGAEKIKPGVEGISTVDQQLWAGGLLHVAAAILALDPPPGFAASLMQETTVELKIEVNAKNPLGYGSGASCADSIGGGEPPVWPPAWTYVVEQSWSKPRVPGTEELVAGVPLLTTRRARTSSGCSHLRPFGSMERMQMVAEMLGIPAAKLGWGLEEYQGITYDGDAQFRSAVGVAIATRERAFAKTAAALVAKGVMTQEEADRARPALRLRVEDLGDPKTLGLKQALVGLGDVEVE